LTALSEAICELACLGNSLLIVDCQFTILSQSTIINRQLFCCFPFILIPGLKLGIFPAESLNTPGCINQFLFARKKGVALGANFNPDILCGGSYLYYVAASTANRGLKILRMYFLFHLRPP